MEHTERQIVEPRAQTITVTINGLKTKVNFRVRAWERPSGLASVCWQPGGEEVGIKLLGIYYKNAASIIWSKAANDMYRYGWSISEEDDLWGSVNTLGYKSQRWTYKTANAAMAELIKYVTQCLETGNLEWK